MPYELKKLTPNLIVSNVGQSIAFYRDVLGFSVAVTVPETAPYVFAIVQSGPFESFSTPRSPRWRSTRRSRIVRLAAR